MDFKFSKDTDDSQQEDNSGEQKKQRALVVLLLILVGGFSYVYFFTGLIKPAKVTEAPVPAAPQVVKMPLPPRDGEPVKADEKTAAKPETPKAAAPVVSATAPATKTAATVPAKPAPPAKAATPAKPKEEPKKAEPAKPTDKKPQAEAAVEKKGEATANAKKPVADKKSAAAPDVVKKPVQDTKKKVDAAPKAKPAESDSNSILIGNYVLEEILAVDMGRVRKAGFDPVVKASTRKKTTMNRLLVSDFADRATAQSTLDKLKKHTSDGFIIEQGGKFTVYAGSYLQSESAKYEKDRLQGAGFSVTLKSSDIAIPSQSLTVGPFTNKKATDAALLKLKNAGLKATIAKK